MSFEISGDKELPIVMEVAGNSFAFFFNKRAVSAEAIAVCRELKTDGAVYVAKRFGRYGFSLFNADGSKARFCGNASLCLAKLIFDNRLVKEKAFEIFTDSGIKRVRIFGNKNQKVALEVGKPHFHRLRGRGAGSVLLKLKCGEKAFCVRGFPVDVGNRHLVFFDRRGASEAEIWEGVNSSALFPDGVNVEFAEVRKNHLRVQVYERGCGKTLACGSGAAAVAFAARSIGCSKEKLVFDGGVISVIFKDDTAVISAAPKYKSENKIVCNCFDEGVI